MVARAIPDAWHFSQPHLVLRARTEAADAVLQRLLGEMVDSEELREAASLAREAVNACHPAGRALFASYLALPWPEKPHMVLWHAATLLREYRGDGHVAALLTAGIDGCEAHVVMAASGKVGRETIQPHRGWTDQEWEAARQRLQQRGWLDSDGALNAEGHAAREAIEDQTNRLALAPWQHLGFERTNRLLKLVRPLSGRIIEQGGIPVPNPMGVPWP
ncbi:MAG TPA: hypothetical protein VH186_10190 [Chloroflexia bacterium]|nr:hypothetical protein [Chloroflexia bacterium]